MDQFGVLGELETHVLFNVLTEDAEWYNLPAGSHINPGPFRVPMNRLLSDEEIEELKATAEDALLEHVQLAVEKLIGKDVSEDAIASALESINRDWADSPVAMDEFGGKKSIDQTAAEIVKLLQE